MKKQRPRLLNGLLGQRLLSLSRKRRPDKQSRPTHNSTERVDFMEIKSLRPNTSAIRSYEKFAGASAGKKTVEKAPVNTDKVDFDFAGALAAAKANTASGIEAEANTARIEQLQAAYSGDNCPVSSEIIAMAVLSQ